MILSLGKTIYSSSAIQKTIYLLQNDFLIRVTEDEYNYVLNISKLRDEEFIESDFYKLLNEQQLRETLNIQFGKLREEIYKKAFSRFEG